MNYSNLSKRELLHTRAEKVAQLEQIHTDGKTKISAENEKTWSSTVADIEEIDYHIRQSNLNQIKADQVVSSMEINKSNADKYLKRGRRSASGNFLGKVIKATQNSSEEYRGLTSSSGTTMIPQDRIQQTIMDLESQNDLGTAGARFMLIEQNHQYPRITDKGSSYFQANELDAITDSSPTITSVKADLKDVAIRFIISNQLLLDASENIEVVLQNAMIEKMNQTVLESVFSGSGASGQPTGLDNLSNILTVDAGGTKLTDYKYHIQAVKKLLDANMRMENLSVFGSPDSLSQLENLSDTTGQPIMQPKMIDRLAQFYTSAIATNYGATTDETKLYLGDFNRMIVGYQGPFTIMTDQSASKLATEVILYYRYDLMYLSPDSFCRVDNIETGLPEAAI